MTLLVLRGLVLAFAGAAVAAVIFAAVRMRIGRHRHELELDGSLSYGGILVHRYRCVGCGRYLVVSREVPLALEHYRALEDPETWEAERLMYPTAADRAHPTR